MKRIWLHGSLEGAWKLASILTSSMPVVLLSRLFVASPLWFMHSSNVSWLPGDIWCLSQGALSLEGAGRGQAGGSSDKHHDGESRGPLKTELGRGVDQIEIGKEEVTFLAQRKANSEACNALVCAKHRNPLILSSGAMGRGDTQDLAHNFQQGQSHPMLAGLLEFLPPGASLSPGQWRASSFHLQTPPAPTHQEDSVAWRLCSLELALQQKEEETHMGHVYLVGSSSIGHSHLTLHFEVCKDVVLPQRKFEVCVCPLMRSPYYKGSRIVHWERAERHVGPGIGKGNNFLDTSLSSLPYQVRCCFLECRDKMSCIAEGPVI